MEAAETACFEQSIVELWGDQVPSFAFCFEANKTGLCEIGPNRFDYLKWNQGHYNENSDLKFEALTEEEILDTINNNNISGIFLKDFNFKELLGDVKYDAYGRIIGD